MPSAPRPDTSAPLTPHLAPGVDRKAVYTLMLINFIDLMGFGLVVLLLPFYALRFDASTFQIAMLQAVYPLCAFIGAPILGAWSDRAGRRPVLIFSQWGSALGYVVLAAAAFVGSPALGLALIFLSRIIDGFTAGNITITNAYVADVIPARDRAGIIGMLGAAFGLGFTFGPPIGGLLGHVHHALPGLLAAALSTVASIMVWRYLPESHVNRAPTDAGTFAFSRKRIDALRGQPMIWWLSAVWFLCMLAYTTLETSVPLILKSRFGYAELQAGLFMGLVGLLIVLVQGGLIRPLKKRLGEWPMAMIGIAFGVAGMIFYARVAAAPVFAVLAVAAIFNAVGRSLKTPTLSSMVSQNAADGAQGSAFGVFQGTASLGRVLGPGIVALMYDRHAPTMFLVGAGLICVAGAILIVVRPRLQTSGADAPPEAIPVARASAESTGA